MRAPKSINVELYMLTVCLMFVIARCIVFVPRFQCFLYLSVCAWSLVLQPSPAAASIASQHAARSRLLRLMIWRRLKQSQMMEYCRPWLMCLPSQSFGPAARSAAWRVGPGRHEVCRCVCTGKSAGTVRMLSLLIGRAWNRLSADRPTVMRLCGIWITAKQSWNLSIGL